MIQISVRRQTLFLWFAALLLAAPTQAWPQSIAAYSAAMENANAARIAGDFVASEQALKEALKARPNDPQALRMLALVQAFRGKLTEALTTIEAAANAAPDDVDIRLTRARIVGWNDNFAQAEAMVDDIVAQVPTYVDAWTLKGRLAYYQSEFDRAKQAFDRARALQPDNLEVILGTGDILRAQGDVIEARQQYEYAAKLYPNDSEVQHRLSQEVTPLNNVWRIDVDGEFSSLSRTALTDWNQQNLRVERAISQRTRIVSGLERAHRFDLDDWSFLLGASHRLTDTAGGYLEVTLGIGADFLPDWGISGGADVRAWKGSGAFNAGVATFDVRARKYQVGTVYSFDAGWQQYLYDGKVWLWGKVLNTVDPAGKHVVGWSLSGYTQVTEELGLRVTGAIAPESDRGVVTDTTSIAAGLSYSITDQVALNITGSRDRRENSYDRHSIRTGLTIRF